MELTFEDQLTDLDWFALDAAGCVGHFTTAGVWPLPRSVAASKDDLELLVDFFENLRTSARASVDADAFFHAGVDLEDKIRCDRYSRCFVAMATAVFTRTTAF